MVSCPAPHLPSSSLYYCQRFHPQEHDTGPALRKPNDAALSHNLSLVVLPERIDSSKIRHRRWSSLQPRSHRPVDASRSTAGCSPRRIPEPSPSGRTPGLAGSSAGRLAGTSAGSPARRLADNLASRLADGSAESPAEAPAGFAGPRRRASRWCAIRRRTLRGRLRGCRRQHATPLDRDRGCLLPVARAAVRICSARSSYYLDVTCLGGSLLLSM